ncbi:hypothetical protein ABBQ32_006657 [Trebouxia sp. C0010 RCD-2024]
MLATHLQPVSVEMPPQNAVKTETACAHGFQDGKAADKAVHDIVIKAMLDSHARHIEAAFNLNDSSEIAVGLTARAICSRDRFSKTCKLAEAARPPPSTRQLSIQHQKQVQIQLDQQPAPGLTLPQASSEATPADL